MSAKEGLRCGRHRPDAAASGVLQAQVFIEGAEVLAIYHLFTSLTMGNASRPAATSRTTSTTKMSTVVAYTS